MNYPEPEVGSVRTFVQALLQRVVPERVLDKAKSVIAAYGSVLLLISQTVPQFSDEAATVAGVVLTIATFLGVYEVEQG